jgi:hypothetical protein
LFPRYPHLKEGNAYLTPKARRALMPIAHSLMQKMHSGEIEAQIE